MITYAQNFEDVMLARLFRGQASGFYIDIGAWHPTQHSVTRHFYDLGWNGINVEPIRRLHEAFLHERPRDINLNVAVGAQSGRLRFYECTDLTSLSTADEKQVEALRRSGHTVAVHEVEMVTLQDIFSSCGNRDIDFLKVDVEGFEDQVLRGADWITVRPRVLVIEATLPAVQITDWDRRDAVRNWDAWEPLLLAAGYCFAHYDGLSRFYLRAEDAHLKGRLELPPGVHDELRFPQVEQLEAKLAVCAATIDAKNTVIRNGAMRELERKALIAGGADVLYYWRRRGTPPGYGKRIAPPPAPGRHIAIDTLEIISGVSGGVETYMNMLTRALIAGGYRVTLLCLPDQLSVLQARFGESVGYFVVRITRAMQAAAALSKVLRGRALRIGASTSMASYARLQDDIGAEILHSPVQIFSVTDLRMPSVVNLHDLQHMHFPENFTPTDVDARNRLFGLSAALSDAIMVASDYVREDIIVRMRVPGHKIFTVPMTWDESVIGGLSRFTVDDARTRYRLPPTYAIYPAQFWLHKNHVRLVQALRIARDRVPAADLKLVLTGYRGYSGWPKVDEAIRRLHLEDDVLCLDHVPAQHLAALYKGAVFCVLPSTFEASSYPVIEAQVLGVPTMSSNVTSLPELMREGAGLLFDAFDERDIADKMVRWLTDPEDARAHAERALVRVRREHGLANYLAGLERVYDFALGNRPNAARA
jgi:FkbM family methyltransferase